MQNSKATYVLQYVLVLGLYRSAHAQKGNYNYNGQAVNKYKTTSSNNYKTKPSVKYNYPTGVSLSLGANYLFENNSTFDTWANNTYHKNIQHKPLAFTMDIAFLEKRFDWGLHAELNNTHQLLNVYWGVGLYHTPRFRGFLNANVGAFNEHFKNMLPPNYTPTVVAHNGQTMYLDYDAPSVGLSFKNVLISHPDKDGCSWLHSIDIQLSYLPFYDPWEYGYYSGKHFYGAPVSNVPLLSNLYFSVSYSFGFLIK